MEGIEREVLAHRINVCGRTVRLLRIGELIVDVTRQCMPCSVERKGRGLYAFWSLDACEEWCYCQLSQEWAQRIKDPLLQLRRKAVKAREIAREMGERFYDVPSMMNRMSS